MNLKHGFWQWLWDWIWGDNFEKEDPLENSLKEMKQALDEELIVLRKIIARASQARNDLEKLLTEYEDLRSKADSRVRQGEVSRVAEDVIMLQLLSESIDQASAHYETLQQGASQASKVYTARRTEFLERERSLPMLQRVRSVQKYKRLGKEDPVAVFDKEARRIREEEDRCQIEHELEELVQESVLSEFEQMAYRDRAREMVESYKKSQRHVPIPESVERALKILGADKTEEGSVEPRLVAELILKDKS